MTRCFQKKNTTRRYWKASWWCDDVNFVVLERLRPRNHVGHFVEAGSQTCFEVEKSCRHVTGKLQCHNIAADPYSGGTPLTPLDTPPPPLVKGMQGQRKWFWKGRFARELNWPAKPPARIRQADKWWDGWVEGWAPHSGAGGWRVQWATKPSGALQA